MNIKPLIISALILNSSGAFADGISSQNTFNDFRPFGLSALYSYQDFRYNSTQQSNFNRYQAHSNLYSVGLDPIPLSKTLFAGISVLQIDTGINSQFSVAPSPLVIGTQTTHNHSIFGHLLKQFHDYFFVNVAALYGQNKINGESWIVQPAAPQQYGTYNNRGDNWFVSLVGLYSRPWQQFRFSADVRGIYSQVQQNAYSLYFPPAVGTLPVPSLRSRATLVMENVEVAYHFKPWFTPFVNAGLIQNVQYSNSRALLPTTVAGPLPQLNLDQNGYKVGGGLEMNAGMFALRLEQQYSQRTKVFHSNQTIVSFKYFIV